jgi:hypothetical protein
MQTDTERDQSAVVLPIVGLMFPFYHPQEASPNLLVPLCAVQLVMFKQ